MRQQKCGVARRHVANRLAFARRRTQRRKADRKAVTGDLNDPPAQWEEAWPGPRDQSERAFAPNRYALYGSSIFHERDIGDGATFYEQYILELPGCPDQDYAACEALAFEMRFEQGEILVREECQQSILRFHSLVAIR